MCNCNSCRPVWGANVSPYFYSPDGIRVRRPVVTPPYGTTFNFCPPSGSLRKEYELQPHARRLNSIVCDMNPESKPKCKCNHTRHMLEALAFLFNRTIGCIKSLLLLISNDDYDDDCSAKLHFVAGKWSVMENIEAPLTDYYDSHLYENMFDECGNLIDPFDPNNTIKLLRLMCHSDQLPEDMWCTLLSMLNSLNHNARFTVDIESLMRSMKSLDPSELQIGCICRKNHRRLKTKFINSLYQLYKHVAGPKLCHIPFNQYCDREKQFHYTEYENVPNVNTGIDCCDCGTPIMQNLRLEGGLHYKSEC